MKTILLILVCVIGMIAPQQLVFGQCLEKNAADNVFPQSYKVDFTVPPPHLYEPGAFHLRFANGEEVPTRPYNDRQVFYFLWASTVFDSSSLATSGLSGCAPMTFPSTNQHPQTGCNWPLVVAYAEGFQTYGDFDVRFMWWNWHNYSVRVDGVLQPIYADSAINYSLFQIDHPTLIEIRDNATGCATVITVYPYVSVWIDPDYLNCDSVTLTANVDAEEPGQLFYLWSTGAVTQSISVLASGYYEVEVKNQNGYVSTEGINPQFIIEPGTFSWYDEDSCKGIVEVWRGTPPFTFEWIGSDGSMHTDSVILVSSNTNYTIITTDACGNKSYDWLEVEDISHTEVLRKDSVYVERYVDPYWNVTIVSRDTTPGEMVITIGDSIGTVDSVFIYMRQTLEIVITADCNTTTDIDTTNVYMMDSIRIVSKSISRSFIDYECLERTETHDSVFTLRTPIDTFIHKETVVLGTDTLETVIWVDSATCLVKRVTHVDETVVWVLTDHYSCGVVLVTDTLALSPFTQAGETSDTVKSTLRYVFPRTTLIAEISEGLIGVFPNPATHAVTIQTELHNWKLEIRDMTGRILFAQENILNAALRLDCTEFPTGVYIIRIADHSGKVGVKKLIVQRE